MKDKRIKIFLGGYINSINAQNLNCRSLALHLDRECFKIGVMTYPGAPLPMGAEFDDVKKFALPCKLYRPLSWVRYITYLRGLLWCDVAYLPKGEIYTFVQRVAKSFGKKTFNTVEGVIDKGNYKTITRVCGSDDNIRKFYNNYTRTFSITKYMSRRNERLLGIKSDGILYLGVETETFSPKTRVRKGRLTDLIFVGSNLKHKNIHEFIDLSKMFPDLNFHIVGGYGNFGEELKTMDLKNMTYHGRLDHKALAKLLSTMDVHVFMSRSEGFPKVTLETAAAGVPSIVYGDYGADEWITTGKDGFVIDTFEEIVNIVSDLKENPEKLEALSAGAVEMARRFDWSILVKDWEKAIVEIANAD